MPTATADDPFVGRGREMGELTTALDGASDGRGGLVMLGGEPGIGKTRLTEELEIVARAQGVRVARGACHEGGGAPPYWPWVQAVRSLLIDPSEATLKAVNAGSAVIAEIIPEIGDVLPDLEPAPEVEPRLARFRLFDSITTLLNDIAASQPLVLVLDDLHWADRASLDLLQFVAREIATRPMLIIGGYRDGELSRRHPLSETLGTLARMRGFQRISLRGLESDAVGHLVGAVGDITPPPGLIEEIHKRTEGNPFFIGEVTRDLAQEAASRGGSLDDVSFRIPEGVREAIGVRLNHLSEESNVVLRSAAVIGRVFDFDLLAAVNEELSDDAMLDLIEEAIATGAVREAQGPKDRYEFTHALIQQTLAEELTTGRRARLQARIVNAIEELYANDLSEHVAELAHHCSEAEAVVGEEKVALYARLAGEKAAVSYAWIEARSYFEQAHDSLAESAPGAERATVLAGLGRAELLSLTYPDIQRGWDKTAQAFDIYDELGDSQSAVTVAVQSGDFTQFWIHGTARVYSRALEMVDPESTEAGHLLKQYGDAVRLEEQDIAKSLDALERSLEIAQRTGDKQLECRALVGLMASRVSTGNFRDGIEFGNRAIEIAGETGQATEEIACHFAVASALVTLGDPVAGWEHTEAQRRLEQRYGSVWGFAWTQHTIALLRGDAMKVDELGEVLDTEYPEDAVIRLGVGIGAWHTEKRAGVDERIQASLEEGQTSPVLLQRSNNAFFLALAAQLMDRSADAVRAGEMARSILTEPKINPFVQANAAVAIGLAAVVTDDAEVAARYYQHLQHLRGILAGWAFPLSGDRLLGLLAHAGGMRDEVAAHFEAALEFTGNAGYRMEVAWTCHDYAGTLLDSDEPGDREKAIALRDRGIAIAVELGMKPLVGRFIALSGRLGATDPGDEAGYADRVTPEFSDEMTNLGNLGLFRTSLQVEQVLASSLGESSAAVKVALDGFQHISNAHGYEIGNQLLREIAETMRMNLPSSTMSCRTGDEEFSFVLRGVDSDTALTNAGSLLRSILDSSVTAGDERVHVSGTAGIVMLPVSEPEAEVGVGAGGSASADRITVFLDEAVRNAQRLGRNSTHLYDPGEDAGDSSASLQKTTSMILDALADDRFQLFSQPIVSVADRSLGHSEVLIRMVNEDGSLRSPIEFIPQAESLNLVQQIDRWVVARAMETWRSRSDVEEPLHLAINVSGRSVGREIASYLCEQADSHSVPHEAITVEITETAAMQDDSFAADMAEALHDAGFKLAIDDFGSGATSLAKVRELRFEYLKLDGILVKDLAESEADREFVSALAKLAHDIGVEVIAEFVQDEATMEFLAECGIEYAQGYYLGRPEPFSS